VRVFSLLFPPILREFGWRLDNVLDMREHPT
jgi:hypothetical protein